MASYCKGGGTVVRKNVCWNIRSRNAGWSSGNREGWRTNCPECGKVCAVGPSSHAIQQHTLKSKTAKLNAAQKKTQKAAQMDLLYADTYDKAVRGESIRPNPSWQATDIRVWIMAYHDAVGDGPKLGALKRWLRRNYMSRYAAELDRE